ncbi:MAG: hypothetical protein H6810_03300 [Phycisphaeraceae bacterium]|nr:MAG: hypothetical protein H6810_03300 [Phycisphaeraceae bacterium]
MADAALGVVGGVLAYTPFIDPLNLHKVWFWLLIPLSVLIAVAYKAVRVPDMKKYWRQVGLFSAQIIVGIIGLYVFSLLVLNWLLPMVV